jgi:penicillin V acylase-like amidase (Ntn superfamily)
MKRTALCLMLAAGFPNAMACTAVDVSAKDGSVIAGRTMEWFYNMQWKLVSFPKGTRHTLTAPPSLKLPEVEQTTKYGFIGIAPGVIRGNAILEGQNTAGLGMSGNFLPGFTEYQTVSPRDKRYVSILDFGTWALGSFGSVDELKKALPKM